MSAAPAALINPLAGNRKPNIMDQLIADVVLRTVPLIMLIGLLRLPFGAGDSTRLAWSASASSGNRCDGCLCRWLWCPKGLIRLLLALLLTVSLSSILLLPSPSSLFHHIRVHRFGF
jgi:hypothetical protein